MVNQEFNIGIVHNKYLKKGGEDEVATNEYQLLKDNGHNVFILMFNNPQNFLLQLFTYLVLAFNPVTFYKCYNWIKKNKIDVLHVHNWFFSASPSIFWAARLCKVPIVMTIHNYRMICPSGTLVYDGKPYLESVFNEFSWKAVKDGIYRNSSLLTFNLAFTIWFNKKIGTWKLIKKFIVLTEHSKTVIDNSHLSSLSKKLVTKPNFFHSNRVMRTASHNDNFLFVGRLSEEKGIKMMLSAFKNSLHKLIIIGDGPLKELVENFTKTNSNVTYLGFKSRDSIDDELRLCSALIFPSIWYETFGLIMIEAFALSTPVIASYCGSAGEIVKHGYNGLHFEKSNVDDLKQKLDYWQELDEGNKKVYRENSFDSYVQHYTPQENLKKIVAIYESVLTSDQ